MGLDFLVLDLAADVEIFPSAIVVEDEDEDSFFGSGFFSMEKKMTGFIYPTWHPRKHFFLKSKCHIGNNLLHISVNRLTGKSLHTIEVFKTIVHTITLFEVGYTQ